MYLLINVGYEGIEDLIYLSEDRDEILNARRDFIIKKVDEHYEMKKWKIKEEFNRIDALKIEEITNRICVNLWDGKEFNCVCKEFGLETSEPLILF